jgi:clan AA aspartic protease
VGTFTVKFTVSHPLSPGQRLKLEGLVDTGALFTQIPADALSQIGIAPSGSRAVHYADGTRNVVPVAKADVAIDGVETATMILCGRPGSLVLLGATTLETLGLGVDPIHKKLITIEAPMASEPGKPVRLCRRTLDQPLIATCSAYAAR